MNGAFWSNTAWYLLLFSTSVAAVAVTAVKSHDRRLTTAFSLAVLGLTYSMEVILLLFLNAYNYYPMIFPHDHFQDAVLGNIFSQVSVSTTAVLFCVLDLRSIFIFIFAGIYCLVNALFVKLGIYVHNWYRSIYTFIGFILYCRAVKRWYLCLTGATRSVPKPGIRNKGIVFKKVLHIATLFFAVFATGGNTLITSQKLLALQVFSGGFFEDVSKDHTATALIYGPALIALLLMLHRSKLPRAYRAGVLIILYGCHWALYAAGIITAPLWWFPFAAGADVLGYYFWIVLLDKMLAGARFSQASRARTIRTCPNKTRQEARPR